METTKKFIGEVLVEIADAIETGNFGEKVRIGITTFDSEHGAENIIRGAKQAQKENGSIEVCLIGNEVDENLKFYKVADAKEAHSKMEELLDSGEIDACVTSHYNFPIGVSTIGRVITPGMGKEMLIATTTGTSATNRIEGMVKNALYGIATSKAIGVEKPTVGILNVDGARQVERSLKTLNENGYKIDFAESKRADGGCVMRGNDLLQGTPDVMVTDSLTGNLLMKMFSAYQTGGSYEASGFGYGPGIGENYNRKILILSRASGEPVVKNAIKYAAEMAIGNVSNVANEEIKSAKKAKLDDIISELNKSKKVESNAEEVKMPKKEVVISAISGIDIMDLEDAVQSLWKAEIYAESGMGCTGPIVLVSEKNLEVAVGVLTKAGFVSQEGNIC